MRADEVLGRTLSQTDNGASPAEPSSGPPNRKALRTLAFVVFLGIAGVVAWAKWATVSSIFHGANGANRIIGLSGRIEGDDSAVAPKTSGRILEVRVREGDSVNAGQQKKCVSTLPSMAAQQSSNLSRSSDGLKLR